eukprot:3413885-Prorocentrum_lima.AAC.1
MRQQQQEGRRSVCKNGTCKEDLPRTSLQPHFATPSTCCSKTQGARQAPRVGSYMAVPTFPHFATLKHD